MYVIKNLRYRQNHLGSSYENLIETNNGETDDDDKYKLDLYVPGHTKRSSEDIPHCGASPVVIFVHGGGWRRGDRSAWKHYMSFLDTNVFVAFILRLFRLYGNIGEAFAEKGIACAVVSYPFSKLSTGWILFEMLTSYIMSAMFLVPICSLILLIFCSLLGQFHCLPATIKTDYLNNWYNILFVSLTSVNLIIASLMTVFLQRYKLSISNVSVLWTLNTFVLCSWKMLGQSGRSYFPLCCFLLTLVSTQGFLFCRRLQQRGVTYHDQIIAIEDAIKFVKTYGSEKELYDSKRLHLMGHSAGGHLVTLLTLQNARTDSDLDIQGVISISGVFDLPKLNRSVLKPLYLYPTFGRSHSEWTKASPTHVITTTYQDEFGHHVTDKPFNDLPPFLLVTAEKDLHLQTDAEVLSEKIQASGGRCFLKTICPSNHFTIVWDFKTNPTSNTKLTQICTDFIFRSGQFNV